LYFEYRINGSGPIQRVNIGNYTGGLAVNAQSADQVATIPNLPAGSHQVRFVVNTPAATGINESNVANNISAWTTVQVNRINPELRIGEFSSTGCTSAADFNAANLCPAATINMVMANSGGHVVSGEQVPYRFDYRPAGLAWVTGVDAGVDTGGILHNQTTGTLQGQITNIPIGLHDVRACANTPASADFVEVDASPASNCSDTGFALPPPDPEMTMAASAQVVRRGDTVDVTWNIRAPYSMTCELLGNVAAAGASFAHTGPTSQNTVTSGELTNQSSFVLSCTPDPIADFPDFSNQTFTATVSVEVIPTVQEI